MMHHSQLSHDPRLERRGFDMAAYEAERAKQLETASRPLASRVDLVLVPEPIEQPVDTSLQLFDTSSFEITKRPNRIQISQEVILERKRSELATIIGTELLYKTKGMEVAMPPEIKAAYYRHIGYIPPLATEAKQ
jgi:hypothetical protein